MPEIPVFGGQKWEDQKVKAILGHTTSLRSALDIGEPGLENTKRPEPGWRSKEQEVGFTRGKKERLVPPPTLRCTHSHAFVVFTLSLLSKLQRLSFYLSALLFQSDLMRENECH